VPETLTAPTTAGTSVRDHQARTRIVVIWIDWYPYHVARFRGLLEHQDIGDSVVGIELVGGVGVHAGLKFRETLPPGMPIQTLLPESNWKEAGQLKLAVFGGKRPRRACLSAVSSTGPSPAARHTASTWPISASLRTA
jgi:hypothetical protein